MEILKCRGKDIKISKCKCSITVKNAEGKTCGIVRDIKHFKDIQTNKQAEYFHILRSAGLWGNSKIDLNNVVLSDGKLYLFRNTHGLESLKKFDPELVEKLDNIHAEAEKHGIEVIEANFI